MGRWWVDCFSAANIKVAGFGLKRAERNPTPVLSRSLCLAALDKNCVLG